MTICEGIYYPELLCNTRYAQISDSKVQKCLVSTNSTKKHMEKHCVG